MSDLTPKQEAFAVSVASGMSQADAYRAAFAVKDGTKDSSIHVNASKLMADAKISQRVNELREPIARKAQMTLEGHLNDLLNIRLAAEEDKQFSAAVSAEVARAKAAGITIEKLQHSGEIGIRKIEMELVKPK